MHFILLILIAWQTHSQNVIKIDSITLSFQVAKKINLDLLDYDRLISGEVEQNLQKCLDLQEQKDSIIMHMQSQLETTRKQITLSRQQHQILKEQLQFKSKRKSSGFVWGFVGLALGVTTGVMIVN